jgi:hypothetical protein
MTFEEKREAALKLLESTDIWRSNYAPPLLRLLWKFGVKVPPPHFVGFAANFVCGGLFFGVAWGLLMWALLWWRQSTPLGMVVGAATLAGLLFGLGMASYYRHGARRNKIPLWKEFQPTSHAPSRT